MILREPKNETFSILNIYGIESSIDVRFLVRERKFHQILGN